MQQLREQMHAGQNAAAQCTSLRGEREVRVQIDMCGMVFDGATTFSVCVCAHVFFYIGFEVYASVYVCLYILYVYKSKHVHTHTHFAYGVPQVLTEVW